MLVLGVVVTTVGGGRRLYPPPVIPSRFRSFLRNPEELNLAEGPAKFTIPGMTYSGGIDTVGPMGPDFHPFNL